MSNYKNLFSSFLGRMKIPEKTLSKIIYFTDLKKDTKNLDLIKTKINFIETNYEGINYKIPFIKINPEINNFPDKIFIIAHGRSSMYFLYENLKTLSNKMGMTFIIYQHPGYYLSFPETLSENNWNNAFKILVDNFISENPEKEIILLGFSVGTSILANYIYNSEKNIRFGLASLITSLPEMVCGETNEKLKIVLKNHLFDKVQNLFQKDLKFPIFYAEDDEFLNSEKIKSLEHITFKGDHYFFNNVDNLEFFVKYFV